MTDSRCKMLTLYKSIPAAHLGKGRRLGGEETGRDGKKGAGWEFHIFFLLNRLKGNRRKVTKLSTTITVFLYPFSTLEDKLDASMSISRNITLGVQ